MVGQYGLLTIVTVILVAGVTNARPPQKIVGGTKAIAGEFPYQVSLRVDGKHICGGTIIGNRHIITAAHCVAGVVTKPYKNLLVVTGSIKRSAGRTHTVKTVHYHSKYSTSSAASPNDIAIIGLQADIVFDANQKKLDLPTSATPTGVTATVSGWGYGKAGSLVLPEDLMKIRVTTSTAADCQKYFGSKTTLYSHQICSRSPAGQGVCQGDSGGPLTYNNQLIGVVSYNVPCALGFPDVYSSVYHYIDWIRKVVAM